MTYTTLMSMVPSIANELGLPARLIEANLEAAHRRLLEATR